MSNSVLLENFYTTERLGNCSGDAGPFGFDIHFALEIEYLVNAYGCDAIIETGTNFGDTAEYLAKQYPNLSVITCETNPMYFAVARERLRKYANVEVSFCSSEIVVKQAQGRFQCPLYYLDAHWDAYWPLADELSNIETGVVCVGDFFIGSAATQAQVLYGFDSYNGIINDKDYVLQQVGQPVNIYVNNATNPLVYPYPCLQRQRRSGRGYFVLSDLPDHLQDSDFFVQSL